MKTKMLKDQLAKLKVETIIAKVKSDHADKIEAEVI